MTRPPAVDEADFVPDDEFDADEFFPFAPVQQWAALSVDITAEQLAVLTFTMCHLNPLTGRFDAKFGRGRVAERFGKSLDWVDKQFKGLVAAGAMTKQHMYWLDAKNRSATAPRSTEPVDPETGAKRAQASNRWRVRMKPAGGASYPGPVNIGEFYSPGKVASRLAGQGGAAEERPPREPPKQQPSTGTGGAAVQRPGGAAEERPGGAAVQRPKQSREGTITDRETKDRGACPPDPPKPAAAAAGPDNNRNRRSSTGSKRKTRGNPLTAHARKGRARELAGPAAVAALAADPLLSIDDLVDVIVRSNPRLTQAQATSRAAALAAWDRPTGKQVPA